MKPTIDHIHITASDIQRAEVFYDAFLSLIGFDLTLKEKDSIPEHLYEVIEYHHQDFSFGIVSPRQELQNQKVNRRRPGAVHHVAFSVPTKEDVDELYRRMLEMDAIILHAPRLYPEYSKDYYAFFFKDSEGIELEIVNFQRSAYF